MPASFFCVKSVEAMTELLDWLVDEATAENRLAFDVVVAWPFVQSLGGFVHNVWTPGSESRTDWSPVLSVFRRAHEVAQQFSLRNYGREVAKAESIVLCESLDDFIGAIRALDEAARLYGDAPILQEQRANALFGKALSRIRRLLSNWTRSLVEEPELAQGGSRDGVRRSAISYLGADAHG